MASDSLKEILVKRREHMKRSIKGSIKNKVQVAKTAMFAAAIALASTGLTATLSPQVVQAANPADIAQLIETGICKGCDLTNADLTGEHLIGADLREADLTGTQLSYANLEGADLTGATLINTDLTGAFLTNALLDNAILQNVDLAESTLIYTSLEGAEVENVDLAGAEVLNTPISIGGSYEE